MFLDLRARLPHPINSLPKSNRLVTGHKVKCSSLNGKKKNSSPGSHVRGSRTVTVWLQAASVTANSHSATATHHRVAAEATVWLYSAAVRLQRSCR